MAPAESGRDDLVAYLDVWVALSEEHLKNQVFTRLDNVHLLVYANAEFSVGRSPKCQHGISQLSDPTISNQHIKFHSIVYDTTETISVPPLVYAENRSMNGTYLQRFVDPTRDFHKEGNVRKYSQSIADMNESVHGRVRPPGRLMDSTMGATLLDEEDELWVNPRLMLNYHVAPRFRKTPDPLEREQSDMKCFAGHYKITGRKIGSGGHGNVYVALHRRSQRQLACKILDLEDPDDRHTLAQTPERYETSRTANGFARHQNAGDKDPAIDAMPMITTDQQAHKLKEQRRQQPVFKALRECKILKDLDHPNIISLEKVYHSPSHIYIFEEMITAGDLFSYIEKRGAGEMPPIEAAVIVWQILKGLEYLHDRNIVHRDLKPDNILLTSTKPGARIVIADFGAARYIDRPEPQKPTDTPAKRMFSIVGTVEYTAPEIYQKKGYSMAVDMWSLGCITASLLSGDVIFVDRLKTGFNDNPLGVVYPLASVCDLSILDTDGFWKSIDHRPKDFIRQSLVLNESERMTVKQALGHAWFTHDGRVVEFKAAYQRATEKWKPRGKIFRAVEQICPPPSDFEGHRSSHFPQDISQCPSVPALGTAGLRTATQRLSPILEEPETLGASPAGPESFEEPGNSIPVSQMPTLEDAFQEDMTQLTISEPDPMQLIHQEQIETQCTVSTIGMTQPGAVDERQTAASFSLRRESSSGYSDIDDVDMFEAERQFESNEPAYKKRRLS